MNYKKRLIFLKQTLYFQKLLDHLLGEATIRLCFGGHQLHILVLIKKINFI